MAFKQYTPYFYLNSNRVFNGVRSNVNVSLLKKDIERGVKRLSEDAYCKHWGITQTSLMFITAVNNFINLEASMAELTYEKNNYTLRVETKSGYTLVFRGVSGGYTGEGSRGAFDILRTCGFNEKQCAKVWTMENFRVINRS